MVKTAKADLIRQVMGASHILCSTVTDIMERTLEDVHEEQLALSQFKLLLLIGRAGHRFKVSDVAEFLGVTNAAASRSTDRLVQRGLVDRSVSKEDRRAVDLTLTPEGRELVDSFAEANDALLMNALGDYTEDRLREIKDLIDELALRLLDVEEARWKKCLRCGVHFRAGCIMRDLMGQNCAFADRLYGDMEGTENAVSGAT